MSKLRYMTPATTCLLVALLIAAGAAPARAADPAQNEQQLIGVLQSKAPKSEKAITCKRLAIYGSKNAVPVLAPLLEDEELASWARIALEAIPDPAADAALREAMGKLQGRLLIGVINSISYRHDAHAVDALAQKLGDADPDVVAASAAALGHIGNDAAAAALEQFFPKASAATSSSVAQGCVICAEQLLADGKRDHAIRIYDTIRKAQLPRQRIIEATRGAIMARGADGIPMLVDLLRSDDKAFFNLGLKMAREMKADGLTDALLGELGRATPERQSLLIMVLADRADANALAAVVKAMKSGPSQVRVVAAGVLERLGNVSCIPALLEAATGDDADVSRAAKSTLARMFGKDIDAALFQRLQASSGRERQILVELAEQRRLEGALPEFLKSADDADAGVRNAALVAIGSIGEVPQVKDLVVLYLKPDQANHAEIEKAIMSICGRWHAACVPNLAPLAASEQTAARITALHAMAASGGPEALASVQSALKSTDAAVQDEAVRTLSTWPNRWPADDAVAAPLLALAKSGEKPQHKILGLRGYLQYIHGARNLNNDRRVALMKEAIPLAERADEKRVAISVLHEIVNPGVLEPLMGFAADPAVTEEACSALVDLAARHAVRLPKDLVRKSLETVLEKSKNDGTRNRARQTLNGLK